MSGFVAVFGLIDGGRDGEGKGEETTRLLPGKHMCICLQASYR